MWEKKLAADDASGNCADGTQANRSIHCVNNLYQWSAGTLSEFEPDGSLFTDFLTNLNRADGSSGDGVTIDRKNYSDWRIPNIAELQAIMDCTKANCLDPIFGATQASFYWSSTTLASDPRGAWLVNFFSGNVLSSEKVASSFARAVRGGR